MLMASIVASMMMGGFLLTVTGDADDDLTPDSDEGEGGHDLYAEDIPAEGVGLEGWGDLLSDLMDDDALVGGPEAVNAGAQGDIASFASQDQLDDQAFLADLQAELDGAPEAEAEAEFEADDFEDDFAAFDPVDDEGALSPEPTWTQDGTEVVIDDFVPGEDELILAYHGDDAEPQIDLFGDPSGNALVFADGHLTFKVIGGDGLVIPEDVKLMPETDEMPMPQSASA